MAVIYVLATPSGDVYTDKEGKEKRSTMIVGRVVETSSGGKMAILDGLPFSAFGGKPIPLYFNDVKRDAPAPTPRTSVDDTTQDIPF